MGTWWLEAAARGGPAMLPLINASPAFEGSADPSARGAAAGSSRVSSSKAAGSSKDVPSRNGKSAARGSASGAMMKPFASGKGKLPVAAVAAAKKAVDETMSAYALLGE